MTSTDSSIIHPFLLIPPSNEERMAIHKLSREGKSLQEDEIHALLNKARPSLSRSRPTAIDYDQQANQFAKYTTLGCFSAMIICSVLFSLSQHCVISTTC